MPESLTRAVRWDTVVGALLIVLLLPLMVGLVLDV